MNTASQNLPHHLGVLRERLLHPTDYEKAVSYFLEEFAGDEKFIKASECVEMPHLVAVLGKVASGAVGPNAAMEGALISYLREHKFVHGNGKAKGHIVIFFYFEEADTGMVMILPGRSGQMDIARFTLKGGLMNPQHN